ncbi:TIGR03364 family FAD-dependent oxidoreductase [Silvimonas sp. JCM 19000]
MLREQAYDVVIIGGGITALSHAWMAHQRGLRVALLQTGGSIDPGHTGSMLQVGHGPEQQALVQESRRWWLDWAGKAGFAVDTRGLWLLCRDMLETRVAEEFMDSTPAGARRADWLDPTHLDAALPHAAGALYFADEIQLDPSIASEAMTRWLSRAIDYFPHRQVLAVESGRVHTPTGVLKADRIFVAAGQHPWMPSSWNTPWQQSRCRLHVLNVQADAPQPARPTVLSGLSLTHYSAFAQCPSVQTLREQQQAVAPQLARHGMHLIMATGADGSDILIGDAQTASPAETLFDDQTVDDALVDLAQATLGIQLQVRQRWQGSYLRTEQSSLRSEPVRGVHLVSMAGAAASLAPALANASFA